MRICQSAVCLKLEMFDWGDWLESRLMECPDVLGYRDGGGPGEYTYEKIHWGITQILTDSQPLIETTTYLQPLRALHRRRLQQFSHNSLDDGEQQP